jgi:hypothetical protein
MRTLVRSELPLPAPFMRGKNCWVLDMQVSK